MSRRRKALLGSEIILTVEIVVPYEHVIYALAREAGTDGAATALLLHVEQQWQELLDCVGCDIVSVRSLDQGLSLDVDDGDERRHGARDVLVLISSAQRRKIERR